MLLAFTHAIPGSLAKRISIHTSPAGHVPPTTKRTSRAGACRRVVRPATVGRDDDAGRACHITEEGEVDCRPPGCGGSVAHTPAHRRERVDLYLREVENPPSTGQLHPNVLRQLRALAEQRTNRIRRRSRLGADRPRVCGADAIGDCVVPQSVLAAIAAVVHGDVGDLDRRAEVQGDAWLWASEPGRCWVWAAQQASTHRYVTDPGQHRDPDVLCHDGRCEAGVKVATRAREGCTAVHVDPRGTVGAVLDGDGGHVLTIVIGACLNSDAIDRHVAPGVDLHPLPGSCRTRRHDARRSRSGRTRAG
eukprot:scaffold662_cov59-Phaeocystis_antarctica.AAC.2